LVYHYGNFMEGLKKVSLENHSRYRLIVRCETVSNSLVDIS
jgi:hypothetical protein